MQLKITARHFDLSTDLKDFANKEIDKLKKYFNHIKDGNLVLTIEKSRVSAELELRVSGAVLNTNANDFDMYNAVEKSVTKMQGRLKKHKAKITDKKPRNGQSIKAAESWDNATDSE
ncbi:MAG: ribosome-associated translation inhibitor RaiA [candidate division Zixibacteria bacterium]|nr:ribosome-associated translation inhibitor RaiA [candidate division Zixibacteria bacterium]